MERRAMISTIRYSVGVGEASKVTMGSPAPTTTMSSLERRLAEFCVNARILVTSRAPFSGGRHRLYNV